MDATRTAPERSAGWIQTFTGGQFWPLEPRPEDVVIEDIAHALALTCRFGGGCREFYSVAQHSVAVSVVLEHEHAAPEYALWGLMHDAAEAYVGDIAGPVKSRLHWRRNGDYEPFAHVENVVLKAIADALNLPWIMDDAAMYRAVYMADQQLLATEARDLNAAAPADWGLYGLPLAGTLQAWPWEMAEHMFLERWEELRRRFAAPNSGR